MKHMCYSASAVFLMLALCHLAVLFSNGTLWPSVPFWATSLTAAFVVYGVGYDYMDPEKIGNITQAEFEHLLDWLDLPYMTGAAFALIAHIAQ